MVEGESESDVEPRAEELVEEINKEKGSKSEKSKKGKRFLIWTIVLVIVIGGYFIMNNEDIVGKVVGNGGVSKVKLTTNHGEIVIELFVKEMPITTGNFIGLVEKGTYNGIIFHRIIDGFMLQGGDPTGTGFGDPNIPNIKDEFTNTDLDKNGRGTISMANAGPNTGSSQFFINLVDNNFLDGKHPVFGKVVEGMDVVDKIAKVQTNSGDKPLENVVIEKAEVI
jgi:peptidylprolyl isomerase